MKTRKLLMIPGPSPVARSIQNEMGRETVAFGDPEFVSDFKKVITDLREMLDCDGKAFVIAGSGTLAMEMTIANVTKKGDSILIVSHGYFGDRFAELCREKGLDVDVVQSEWGRVVPPEKIREALSKKKYAALTVTHVDTSTGVEAPIGEIGAVMKDFPDVIYIVDGVCATGGIPEPMGEMGIDVVLSGSQKAFGVAPGLALIWAGQKALKRREQLGSIPEYYMDFNRWIPIMDDPSKYFATPAINLVWALAEAIRIMKEETMEKRYERHRKYAAVMQNALETLGFTVLAEKEHRACTLSNLIYPEGTDDVKFRTALAGEGVQVAGGLGPYAGKMFRLGHMGNIDMHDLISVIAAIERAMKKCGLPVKLGAGCAAVQEGLTE